MKSSIRTIALAALVSIASLSPALHAQTASLQARFDVPFSFDCGTTHLSAGVYTLTVPEGNILVLRNSSQAVVALVQMAYDPTPSRNTLATFKKYGDRYFLEEITASGKFSHAYVAESGAEKRAARESGEAGTQIAVAALPPNPRRAGN